MTHTGVIGLNSKMPWKIRKDIEFFKNITTNFGNMEKRNSILMGSKT